MQLKEEVIGEGKVKEEASVAIEAVEVERIRDLRSVTSVDKNGLRDVNALHVPTNTSLANVRVT